MTTAAFGGNPIIWQIVGILTRFLIAFSAWWAFCQVWPQNRQQILYVVLLIIVFPGYGQQWVALTHVNQEMIPLIFYLLSIGMTAYSIRQPQNKWAKPLALVFAFLGLFPTEYFIGFELIRGLIIFYLIKGETFFARIKKTFIQWSGYLALWLANFGWLYWYYRSSDYVSYKLNNLDAPFTKLVAIEPVSFLGGLANTLWTAGVLSWTQAINIFSPPYKTINIAAIMLVTITSVAIAFCLHRLDLSSTSSRDNTWAFQAIGLGLLGIFVGRLPSWIAGLPFQLNFDFDRLMISAMVGSCFLLAGIIDLLVRAKKAQIYIISGLLAISIGFQFVRANTFKNDLILTRRYFWQMAWRIPAMQPGTILITSQMPMLYESDYQLTSPLNWIYSPIQSSNQLNFAILSMDRRLGGDKLPSLVPGQTIHFDYRTTAFTGSTSDMIALYAPLQSCLKVLDPVYYDQTAQLTRFIGPIADTISYSNISRIKVDSPQPNLPPELFGREPEHTWCYYYEKADLARQNDDWNLARQLLDEAKSKGYNPQDPLEWLIVIDTLARTGRPDDAHVFSLNLANNSPQTISSICKIWKRILTDDQDPNANKQAENIFPEIGCKP